MSTTYNGPLSGVVNTPFTGSFKEKELLETKRHYKLSKHEKDVLKAINFLLRDLKKNAISDEHRKATVRLDCVECRFRVLEGLLEEYEDTIKS
jgi:hypothetical protein